MPVSPLRLATLVRTLSKGSGRIVIEDDNTIEAVYIFGVSAEGSHVWVDLYGSEHLVCGSVRFSFENPVVRREHLRTLRQWARDVALVDYENRGGTVSLRPSRLLLVPDE